MTMQAYAEPECFRLPELPTSREDFLAVVRATADPSLYHCNGLFWDVSWLGVASLPRAVCLLQETGRLLADPTSWGKETIGPDRDPLPAGVDSRGRRQLSLMVALLRAELYGHETTATAFLSHAVLTWLIGGPISCYNDAPERTHADVLDMLQQGVALLREAAGEAQS